MLFERSMVTAFTKSAGSRLPSEHLQIVSLVAKVTGQISKFSFISLRLEDLCS